MRLGDLQKQKKYHSVTKVSVLPSGNEVWLACEYHVEDCGNQRALEVIVDTRAVICPITQLVLTLKVDDQSLYYDY